MHIVSHTLYYSKKLGLASSRSVFSSSIEDATAMQNILRASSSLPGAQTDRVLAPLPPRARACVCVCTHACSAVSSVAA